MSKKKRGESKRKLPYPHKEEAEFGRSPKGILVCKQCGACFYKKSWHHGLHIRQNGKKRLVVTSAWCPACSMIDNGQYEGKVLIERAPARLAPAVIQLVHAFCDRAYHRDSQHRLIEIKNEGSQLAATTTENQLAVRLGRKIRETFKGAQLHVSQAKAPSDVTLVRVTLKEEPALPAKGRR